MMNSLQGSKTDKLTDGFSLHAYEVKAFRTKRYLLFASVFLAIVFTVVINNTPFIIGTNQSPRRSYAYDVNECANVKPRKNFPLSANDVRIDDIQTIVALGDSITAAFAAKGVLPDNPQKEAYEYRGLSYPIGGDQGAPTFANMLKRYSIALRGQSISYHPVEFCYGLLCAPYQYRPELDQLNAAQSGSMVFNIERQLKGYILPQINSKTAGWTFITIQIGSNDLCMGCEVGPYFPGYISPDGYEDSIRRAIDLIAESIPRVIVNLVGVFNISKVYSKTHGNPYCERFNAIPHLNVECPCLLLPGPVGQMTRKHMDELAMLYNERLDKIARSYTYNATFGVRLVAKPARLDLSSWPIESLSDWDCFHPSELAHAYLAKQMWNEIVDIEAQWNDIGWIYPDALPVACLKEDDRIRLGPD